MNEQSKHPDKAPAWKTVAAAPGPSKDPHASMRTWDRSWKPHHLPVWARKALRLNAIKKGNWLAYPAWPVTNYAEIHLPRDLFDHWGSIKRGATRALITQPYGERDALALSFAAELGWSVKSFTPGPWNEGTWCYEFLPNAKLKHGDDNQKL